MWEISYSFRFNKSCQAFLWKVPRYCRLFGTNSFPRPCLPGRTINAHNRYRGARHSSAKVLMFHECRPQMERHLWCTPTTFQHRARPVKMGWNLDLVQGRTRNHIHYIGHLISQAFAKQKNTIWSNRTPLLPVLLPLPSSYDFRNITSLGVASGYCNS